MKKENLPKAVAIVGPTAAGKTKLGVAIAQEFNGEVVSADSRQIYKYLDICTGKDKDDYIVSVGTEQCSVPTKISYHLIDILEPHQEITVADFQKKAFVAIDKITKKNRLPVIVGGSPFYIYSITEGWQFSKIAKDEKLRKKLNKLSLPELQNVLRETDSVAFKKIDQNNPRRLMRAIEVCAISGKDFEKSKPVAKMRYNFLFLGIRFSNSELKERIRKRLKERFKEGMIEEVKNILAKKQVSYENLARMGLEPRFIAYYLQNKINKEQLEDLLLKNIYRFAKRQMTWFKKDKRIQWIKNAEEAKTLTAKFL